MKATIADIKNITDGIDSWLRSREGPLLYDLASKCSGRGAIVEIGSWKEKSTIWLAKGAKKSGKVRVFAIDPHTGSSEHREAFGEVWTFEEFKRNIASAEVDDVITPILGTAEEASENFDRPVEMIFIDGAHDYDSVRLDLEKWFPKVIDGGIIVFHDRQWPGVKEVVKESVLRSRNFRNVRVVKNTSLVFAEKTARNSVIDVLKNRCLILLVNLNLRTRIRRLRRMFRNHEK